MSECQCSLSVSLTGDGCRYCQPQEYIDKLTEYIDEERAENAALIAERDSLVEQIALMNNEALKLQAELDALHAKSVTNMLLSVIPGDDGMGHEVFAKSVNDVATLLAEPEAEPVAWTSMEQLVVGGFLSTAKSMWLAPGLSPYANVPLYTHPPRQSEPEQEPVAWLWQSDNYATNFSQRTFDYKLEAEDMKLRHGGKLYPLGVIENHKDKDQQE